MQAAKVAKNLVTLLPAPNGEQCGMGAEERRHV